MTVQPQEKPLSAQNLSTPQALKNLNKDSVKQFPSKASTESSHIISDETFRRRLNNIKRDFSRDALITPFGKAVLEDRYLLEGETIQGLFARVAAKYADDANHAQRLYDYISKLWFMPATPVLSNGGAKRGLPISCFLNEVNDSLKDISDTWMENVWLASHGGGIGTYWGNVRSIGEKVKGNGKTSGIMPFIKVMDGMTLAISQGNLRRGSAAVYLPVSHPEIEEFIEIRRPTGGDPNRKSLNLHHGVVITDDFMNAVINDDAWELKSPHDSHTVEITRARELWIRILTARVETGEPYLLFIDTVNNKKPKVYHANNHIVKTSNLCSEITLATGKDRFDEDRTAVCCLSSVNIEKYEEWRDHSGFIEDIMRFLDNVLQDFIDNAPDSMSQARYSAMRERSVGLGVMGFHSFLKSKMVPFGSVIAQSWNRKIFKHLKEQADKASVALAEEKGACPDAADYSIMERFANKIAVAPTASISVIAGGASAGIEPSSANSYTHKTLTGSFNVKDKHLKGLLASKGKDTDEIWSSIMLNEGSIQHLEFLSEYEKEVFKTAFEIDPMWIIEHAADRTDYICQAQSLNVFIPADIHKKKLNAIHIAAWKKGVKSMYYCRSKSVQRAENASKDTQKNKQLEINLVPQGSSSRKNSSSTNENKYDECLACQ